MTTSQANSLPPTGNAPLPTSTGTGTATPFATTGTTTESTSSGSARPTAAGKGRGNRVDSSDQIILWGVVGLLVMAIPAVF